MNETEQKLEAADAPSVEALRNEVRSIQSVLSFALMLMFIFTVCVNIFLFRQATAMNMEANTAELMVRNFMTTGEGQTRDLWSKLSAYASTHPDFMPVYNKWSAIITIHSNTPPTMPAAKK